MKPETTTLILVAVYGSLRAGCGNAYHLEGSKLVATGKAHGWDLFDYARGSFPAAAPAHPERSGVVVVEVYEVSPATFRRLDRLEGYPRFYSRELVDVTLEGGGKIEAWTYFLSPREASHGFRLDPIPGGDWIAYLSERGRSPRRRRA